MNGWIAFKTGLEILYYIAFIYLTTLIVKYAKATYFLQAEKHCKMLCKICILGRIKDSTQFGIELFNYGNDVAKNVKITIGNAFSFDCDFIKPNESITFPLGLIILSRDGNDIATYEPTLDIQPDSILDVCLSLDGKNETHKVHTNLLSYYK